MSIQERNDYAEALALIRKHGMVAIPELQLERFMEVVVIAKQLSRDLESLGQWTDAQQKLFELE